jgi:hypothetical protein
MEDLLKETSRKKTLFENYITNMDSNDFKTCYEKLITNDNKEKLHFIINNFFTYNLLSSHYKLDNEIDNICKTNDIDQITKFFNDYKYKIKYNDLFYKAVDNKNNILALYIINNRDDTVELHNLQPHLYDELQLAYKTDNLYIFKLIYSTFNLEIPHEIFENACRDGNLLFVQFIASTKKFSIDTYYIYAYRCAIVNNQEHIIKWLDENYNIEFNLSSPSLFGFIDFNEHKYYINKVFNQLDKIDCKNTIIKNICCNLIKTLNIDGLIFVMEKYKITQHVLNEMFKALLTFPNKPNKTSKYFKEYFKHNEKQDKEQYNNYRKNTTDYYEIFTILEQYNSFVLKNNITLFNLKNDYLQILNSRNIHLIKWIENNYKDKIKINKIKNEYDIDEYYELEFI